MENSGNICQSGQTTDSQWPNMMSGNVLATVLFPLFFYINTFHYRSSALIIKQTMPSLWSFPSKPKSIQGPKTPKTLESLSFLSWCWSGLISNKKSHLFLCMSEGWQRAQEFDYSIMFLSQSNGGVWVVYAARIAARLNLLSGRAWCHSSFILAQSFSSYQKWLIMNKLSLN